MRIPMKWLSRYVDLTGVTAEQVAALLTSRGLEIAGIEQLGEDIQNVVVGRIDSITPHPDSDHMLICMVDAGSGEELQIVTGAPNVKVGDHVPVALHGSHLPGGVKIKKGKLRGVESCGMLCSGEELQLTEHDFPGAGEYGILILREKPDIGTDIREVVGLNDQVLEAEPTPNRPDFQSVIGVAREVAAALGRPLTLPKPQVKEESGHNIHDFVKVEVENGELCPRYMARTVRDIKIEPSPAWMRDSLRAAGIRAINNIVDITNYVMLEYGQPMHAFDLARVDDNHIVVRTPRPGETSVTTLDDKERELTPDTLLICDAQKPVGVAGVMGGLNSEITENTKTVLFESAKFNGYSLRLTAKRMGLMTEASQRFVKGIDIEATQTALERACELVELLGAGKVDRGVIDVVKTDLSRRTITARPEKINARVALEVPAEQMAGILNSLCVPTTLREDGLLHVEVPHFRDDIEGEADISEEVARVVGYDHIPLTLMRGDLSRGRLTLRQRRVDSVRSLLCAEGAYECVTYSFTGPAAYDKLLLPENSPCRSSVKILNPFGEDASLMRTTLAVSMLPTVALNLNQKAESFRLYEISQVHFAAGQEGVIPEEKQMVCIAAVGPQEDFYTLKGVVEQLCGGLGIDDYSFAAGGPEYYHPGRKAVLTIAGKQAGVLGEVHPTAAENYGISERVYLAELELDALFAGIVPERKYRALPRYPAVDRDLAVVLDASVPAGSVAAAIRKAAGKLCEKTELFDVYTGSHVPEGQKSLAYSIRLRSDDHTLSEEEINSAMHKIVAALEKDFGAKLRS